jgi:hypothetical protein
MEISNSLNESSMSNKKNRHNNIISGQQRIRGSIQRTKNEDIDLQKIINQAYHFKCKGELELDLKTNLLTWSLKGEKSQEFLQRYKNGEDKIIINKEDINKIMVLDSPNNNRYLIKIIIKSNKDNYYIFSFQDKDNSRLIRNKYYELLSNDYYNYYKNEFYLLSTEDQKKIALLMSTRYLRLLYRKIYSCYSTHDIEKIWIIIKMIYPELITINLGKNNIQLSRDEELMMLVERKYNVTKLINSDRTIYKSYKNIKNIKDKNFWDNFIDRQKGNNTYIVGGYKQCVWDKEDNGEEDKEKPINIIFEDLEKDKYFYDDYETNYLYHNENMKKEIEKNIPEIKLLNDYSMNKIKENNYFSYSFQCINGYNRAQLKNRSMRNNISSSSIKYGDIREEKLENDTRYKNRLKKESLLNKIKTMENAFNQQKKNTNTFYTTMKKINEENRKMYELAKFEPSGIPVNEIFKKKYITFTLLIKDLVSAFNIINKSLIGMKKQEEKSSSPSKRYLCDYNIKNNYERFYKEIKSIYEGLKTSKQKENLINLEKVYNFLQKNAEIAIERMNNYK